MEYGPVELTTCYYAMIRDPAGNPVFLHQRKAAPMADVWQET